MQRPFPSLASRQRGVTLVITMLMLVLIALIVVSTIRTSTADERMAGASRDRDKAFQAAEAAVQICLNQLKNETYSGTPLPTLQSKKPAIDIVTSERVGSRGQTGARLGGVEPGKNGSTDCAQWLLAGGSNTSIAGMDIATCKSGTPRISWRQLK